MDYLSHALTNKLMHGPTHAPPATPRKMSVNHLSLAAGCITYTRMVT